MKILRASYAVILLIYSVPAVLSLFDIYQGKEPNLSTEWIVVCVFFILFFGFIIVNFLGLKKEKE
ncbi:MAG: hypothetical protein HQ541_17395 [Mariniphaga sp.]|nr:hypothetical protein [Mariniphaga sp.]